MTADPLDDTIGCGASTNRAVLSRIVAAVVTELREGVWGRGNGALRDLAEDDVGMRLLVPRR